jgi:hypothetical protein
MQRDERKDTRATPAREAGPGSEQELALNPETVRDLDAGDGELRGGAVAVSRRTCGDECHTAGCL